MSKKEFQLDLVRYAQFGWKYRDHEKVGDDYEIYEYDFGLPEEDHEALMSGQLAAEKEEVIDKVEKKIIAVFTKPDQSQDLFSQAQSLAVEYARARLHHAMAHIHWGIDPETKSDHSIIETEKWWSALEEYLEGDWSLMLGCLDKLADEYISSARTMFGSEVPESEFAKFFATMLTEKLDTAFEWADDFYNAAVAIKNMVAVLEENLDK